MADKRKDSKGRVLRSGESQRKDGRYDFRYTDACGKRRSVYAETLQELRKKEDEITASRSANVNYREGGATVLELVERYTDLKQGVRYNTKVGYTYVKNILKNPFQFNISEVVTNDSRQREAMTEEEQDIWMSFIREDPKYQKYYDEFVVLLGTGLRVSEFCGLTMEDLDFKRRRIRVDHQLVRERGGRSAPEGGRFRVGTPECSLYARSDANWRKIGVNLCRHTNSSEL